MKIRLLLVIQQVTLRMSFVIAFGPREEKETTKGAVGLILCLLLYIIAIGSLTRNNI